MQVQSINSTNQYNNSFKAKFINDKNNYFRNLWEFAYKTSYYNYDIEGAINNFAKKNKDDVLEIIDMQTRQERHETVGTCTIFNHSNGRTRTALLYGDKKTDWLKQVLDQIEEESCYLFDKMSKDVKMYRRLTGQKVEPEYKV